MERDKIKTDLSALFMPRQPAMTADEAVSIRSTAIVYFQTIPVRGNEDEFAGFEGACT